MYYHVVTWEHLSSMGKR